MGNRSTFPSQIDVFAELTDLPADKCADAETLRTLMAKPNKTPDEISQMNTLVQELANYYISTETWNKFCDCLVNVESFVSQKITSYYQFVGNYDPTISYNVFNSVLYTDGNIYLLKTLAPSYVAGIAPTNTSYWLKLSSKGDQGQGLTWRGNYDNTLNYNAFDMVNYNNSAYICTANCKGIVPTNMSNWALMASKGSDGLNLTYIGTYSSSYNYVVGNAVSYNNSIYYCTSACTNTLPTNTSFWSLFLSPVTQASAITIVDSGNIITATNVEDALQEGFNKIGVLNTNFDSHKTDYTLQVPYAGVTTGTVNTYAISTPTITTLKVGTAVCLKFHADSTGVSTLNWCGLGAKGIKKSNGTDVTNLKATGIYTLRYDGTNFILQGEGGSGNATASDLLSGKTASTDAGDIVGILALTGTATVSDVVSGKTFYNTDAKSMQTGTATVSSLGGKRYASGTTVSSDTQYAFQQAGTTATSNQYLVSVGGLSFKPSTVILKYYNGTYEFTTTYEEVSGGVYAKTVRLCVTNLGTFNANNFNYKGDVSPAMIVTGGFTLPVSNASTIYTWKAYE